MRKLLSNFSADRTLFIRAVYRRETCEQIAHSLGTTKGAISTRLTLIRSVLAHKVNALLGTNLQTSPMRFELFAEVVKDCIDEKLLKHFR
ncbi:MAG: hypothetical protein ACOY3I_01805 [Verrucomicrobiota bacterium]